MLKIVVIKQSVNFKIKKKHLDNRESKFFL